MSKVNNSVLHFYAFLFMEVRDNQYHNWDFRYKFPRPT